MSGAFVLDCSVTMAWFFAGEATPLPCRFAALLALQRFANWTDLSPFPQRGKRRKPGVEPRGSPFQKIRALNGRTNPVP